MVDVFTKAKRSDVMAQIGARDTKPELAVRSMIHAMGYRFRLHRPDLPGKPDLVLPRYKIAVFVHGCFWHRHRGCRFACTPRTRIDFWLRKLEANVVRDRRVSGQLRRLGWRVITVWECELRSPERLSKKLAARLGRRPRDEIAQRKEKVNR